MLSILEEAVEARTAELEQTNESLHHEIKERVAAEKEKEKVIKELQTALSEVKTLSGLLPVCSQCKKIRDDKGYWNQIDTYLSSHTKVSVSHSLCPECAKNLYGDQHWFKKLSISSQPDSKRGIVQPESLWGHEDR